MHQADFIALLPLIIVAGTSVLVMLAVAIQRSHFISALLTVAGLAAAFGSLKIAQSVAPRKLASLLVLDSYGIFYIGLMLAASLCVALLAYGYLEQQKVQKEEFYILLLLATLGSEVLIVSNHFVSFFLALEILSISLYALNAYLRMRSLPLEAGIKYLILAATSAAFLLFGMALLYSQAGTMNFQQMAASLPGAARQFSRAFAATGLALLITGIGFKLGVVPFHLWTPDIYEGAPAPVTAWIATASKGSMFVLLMRYFYGSWAQHWSGAYLVLSVIAIASMLIGNILALLQQNVKRILAYSSIAHLGYLLVAFQASGNLAMEAVTFYLVAYFVTTLGAFGVVASLSSNDRDADLIEDYRGLFWRRPGMCLIFTAMLLSLAGIPLTAGFIAKFYILAAGASAGLWALILILVISSVIGLFYYLRIAVALYQDGPRTLAAPTQGSRSFLSMAVLCLLTILLIWFGVYPQQLLELIHSATINVL